MPLLMTSRDLHARAAQARGLVRSGEGAMPEFFAAASALGSSAFLRMMKPGGWKTLAGLGAVGGGGYFAFTGHTRMVRGAGAGFAAGGLWSLLMRG